VSPTLERGLTAWSGNEALPTCIATGLKGSGWGRSCARGRAGSAATRGDKPGSGSRTGPKMARCRYLVHLGFIAGDDNGIGPRSLETFRRDYVSVAGGDTVSSSGVRYTPLSRRLWMAKLANLSRSDKMASLSAGRPRPSP
jgi:hypothetical protein